MCFYTRKTPVALRLRRSTPAHLSRRAMALAQSVGSEAAMLFACAPDELRTGRGRQGRSAPWPPISVPPAVSSVPAHSSTLPGLGPTGGGGTEAAGAAGVAGALPLAGGAERRGEHRESPSEADFEHVHDLDGQGQRGRRIRRRLAQALEAAAGHPVGWATLRSVLEVSSRPVPPNAP